MSTALAAAFYISWIVLSCVVFVFAMVHFEYDKPIPIKSIYGTTIVVWCLSTVILICWNLFG